MIPSTIDGVVVTAIGNAANYWDSAAATSFANKQLTSVTIPDGVTSIGSSAFYSNQLTSVTIPDGVTSIGGSAFSDNQLASVTIPGSVTSIGQAAFSANRLTSLAMPDSVTELGDYAFSANRLQSLSISSSLTRIGAETFAGGQLQSVTIPSSVNEIGYRAFTGNQLTEVAIANPATTDDPLTWAGNPNIASFTIGGTTYSPIDRRATSAHPDCLKFDGAGTITQYAPAPTIADVQSSSWFACAAELDIPEAIGGVPVTAIGDDAFYAPYSSSSLSSVAIPSSVTTIGAGAFYDNRLTLISIPGSVAVIGQSAFAFNYLERVSIEGNPTLGSSNTIGSVFHRNGLDRATAPLWLSAFTLPRIHSETAEYYQNHADAVRIYASDPDFIATHSSIPLSTHTYTTNLLESLLLPPTSSTPPLSPSRTSRLLAPNYLHSKPW